ncbi:hypothetical protein BpHYR1_010582 [Brachionus plicatilis]|uniref:Uncharacterized protein n=1 Tax=Brachionus plicatilis TaxID=10195 RepID=A0A3M7QKR1_BRAPC|nr:hypothetical protein BpHYR1_010582 [Brachionus plicatilis]
MTTAVGLPMLTPSSEHKLAIFDKETIFFKDMWSESRELLKSLKLKSYVVPCIKSKDFLNKIADNKKNKKKLSKFIKGPDLNLSNIINIKQKCI